MNELEQSKLKIEKLVENQKELLQDDEEAFKEVVDTITLEQLKEMSDDEILAFNNYEEGKYYVGEPEFENKEDLVEYVRSILCYLKETFHYTQDLDLKLQELKEITKETTDALNEYYGIDKLLEADSSIEVIRKAIDKSLRDAEASGSIEKYATILKSKETFEETFTLDRIKELYSKLDPSNLKADANSERSLTIYKNYIKVQQKLGSRYDLIQIQDLEVRFLPEEYHELNNLFIIAVIKYISKCMKDGYYSSDTAFFVSQLTTNLFLLHLNKIPENYKETLLTNIKEFLDMLK